MWTEKYTAIPKALKLLVTDDAKVCELTLDLGDFPAELAYGLESGREQLNLLLQGTLTQTKYPPDGRNYVFTAQYLGDRYMHVKGATVEKVTLTAKNDDDCIRVNGAMVVAFRWSAEDLLFFAHGLTHEMEFGLALEQLEMPVESAVREFEDTLAEHGATVEIEHGGKVVKLGHKAKPKA